MTASRSTARPTAARAPACSAPRTARSGRRRSCRWGRRGRSRASTPTSSARLGAQIVLGNTYHLHFRPGDEVIAELGGLHALHGLGRADPHRLGRLPGLLAPRHALRASTTRASPSARSTTARRRASRRSSPPRSSATSAPTSRCASTSARRRACRGRARGGRAPNDALGRAPARRAARAPGQLLFGIAQGGADPELRRRSIEEIAALDFDGYALGGLAVGESREEMFEAIALGGAAPAGREAALLHGHRRRRGHPERDRARDRHVRLRPPDPHGAHRLGAHRDRPAQPPQRPLRPRPAAARGGLRLPCLRAFLARLRPPPRQPGGAARPAAPEPA